MDQVRSMLQAQLLSEADFAWHQSLTEWISVSALISQFECSNKPQPPPALAAVPPLTPSVLSGITEHPNFGWRLVACMIDTVVTSVLGGVTGLLVGAALENTGVSGSDLYELCGAIGGIVAAWLYYALLESSDAQATLGKMACRFRVTDLQGRRISFLRASGRHFGKLVSVMTLGVGYLMCAFTRRRQCLHDIMAECLMYIRPDT